MAACKIVKQCINIKYYCAVIRPLTHVERSVARFANVVNHHSACRSYNPVGNDTPAVSLLSMPSNCCLLILIIVSAAGKIASSQGNVIAR